MDTSLGQFWQPVDRPAERAEAGDGGAAVEFAFEAGEGAVRGDAEVVVLAHHRVERVLRRLAELPEGPCRRRVRGVQVGEELGEPNQSAGSYR